MRQRVGLAQALIHKPDVLILDEPTIGLDPAQVVNFRNLIKEIGRDRTVILSTHILPEAQQVCDRVLIINKGKIVAEDTPGQLQARLTGSRRVTLEVRGDGSDLPKLVSKIPGITHAAMKSDTILEFEAQPGHDPRPQVARAVVEAGYDLLEMQPVSMSLEDIFLQLTREEPNAQDAMPELDASLEGD